MKSVSSRESKSGDTVSATRRSAPAFDPPSGQFERLLLDSQAFAGDRELAARAARIGIGAGGFGGDGDATYVEGRLSGARIGSARL